MIDSVPDGAEWPSDSPTVQGSSVSFATSHVSCYAEKPADITPLDERWYVPLSSVQSLHVVELKLSLRMRDARAQPVEKSIASLALRLC
jgi:hypothetical protein